jgi:excisionase family DNA binding protein
MAIAKRRIGATATLDPVAAAARDIDAMARDLGLTGRATVTVDEAARIVGISLRTLRSHIAADAFPHRRVGGRVVVPVRLLLAWLLGDDGE